jgi:hypothetical protein
MKKLTLTFCDPDQETTEWAAAKIRDAYCRELDIALAKAAKALSENKDASIKTKPLRIEIVNCPKPA